MSDIFWLLWPPFLVAVCLVGIHTYFGLQILARNVIFVDLALAQIAALGTTVAFMLGYAPQSTPAYGYSLLFALLAAVLLASTRSWSQRLPQEALIGIIYVVAAAAAIVLIDRAPQGAEHLKQILTGNILTTGWTDLRLITPVYLAVGTLHWWLRRRLMAEHQGSWAFEFLFYATFGVVVTSSVALAGVLLVFSFLIIPAAVGVLYSDREALQLLIGWGVGTIASLAGLVASYAFDLPTGAAMVCAFGLALALAVLAKPAIEGNRWAVARGIMVVRTLASVVLGISGLWLLAAPRADQPVLDGLERAFPILRPAYMTDSEQAAFLDADAHAERYRREAQRLSELERRSRSDGAALEDVQVMRISSMLKTYNEMRKGEEFVKREVRSRARQRARWMIAALALLASFLLAPERVRRAGRIIRRASSALARRLKVRLANR
jgi:zinc/manganese transport system permease protein